VQVEGSKIFRVADPSNNARMYEGYMREAILEAIPEVFGNGTTGRYRFLKRHLLESTSLVHSPIDINLFLDDPHDETVARRREEQLKKYPASKDIWTMDCRVNKGEALWLPSYWWHEVTSIPGNHNNNFSPLNIAINIWFDPLFQKEFPCKLCQKKKINQVYAKTLTELLKNGRLKVESKKPPAENTRLHR
jgi:peptidyl-lysine (3S)-dioxygenase / protease